MLRTRLWVGSLLATIAAGVLFVDATFAPYYPFLFASVLALGYFSTRELLSILPINERPRTVPTTIGVCALLALNWLHVPNAVALGLAFAILSAFLVEMATYTGDGNALRRVTMAAFIVGYLGFLPGFFVQLRWSQGELSGLALAVTICVPKLGDVGAYLMGRAFGRHKMTPLLSPKKTWQGFAGGMIAAISTAIAFGSFEPRLFAFGLPHAIAFGVLVGLAGVLGDLAESLVKRECGKKDASQTVPGFGGILDVIDSVLFAAPVAYLLFRLESL